MSERVKTTYKEERAIAALRDLAEDWPSSLWLFSANGTLHVMKKRKGSRATTTTGGMDERHAVAQVDIENDGGDW